MTWREVLATVAAGIPETAPHHDALVALLARGLETSKPELELLRAVYGKEGAAFVVELERALIRHGDAAPEVVAAARAVLLVLPSALGKIEKWGLGAELERMTKAAERPAAAGSAGSRACPRCGSHDVRMSYGAAMGETCETYHCAACGMHEDFVGAEYSSEVEHRQFWYRNER